jgi:hypothetical protein
MRREERQKIIGYVDGAMVMAKARIASLRTALTEKNADEEIMGRLDDLESDVVRNFEETILCVKEGRA